MMAIEVAGSEQLAAEFGCWWCREDEGVARAWCGRSLAAGCGKRRLNENERRGRCGWNCRECRWGERERHRSER